MIVYRTTDGRYGKLRINLWSWWQGNHTMHGINIFFAQVGTVDYKFVTFNPVP